MSTSVPELSIRTSGKGRNFVEARNIFSGRLSLSDTDPVNRSGVTTGTTLYYVPYSGNQSGVFVNDEWSVVDFDTLSVTNAGLEADKNYDVALVVVNNRPKLILIPPWTGGTTRNTDYFLSRLNGVLTVNSGSNKYVYLGTVRTNASGQFEDSQQKRLVWNWHNQVKKTLKRYETTASWTYNSTTARPANNNLNNRFEFVTGYGGAVLDLSLVCRMNISGNFYGQMSFGVNSSTVPLTGGPFLISQVIDASMGVTFSHDFNIGFNQVYWLEQAFGGSVNFLSTASGSGISSSIYC